MTKKQFEKCFVGFSRNEIKAYTDFVKSYKGRLSYLRMFLLMKLATETFGKSLPDETLCYIEAVMKNKVKC